MSSQVSSYVGTDGLALSGAVEMFTTVRLARLSPHTREWYAPKLHTFCEFIGPATLLNSITEVHIDIYVSSLYDPRPLWENNPHKETRVETYSPATIHNHCKAVRSLFNWLRRKRYIDRNPSEVIDMPDLKQQPVKPIEPVHLARLKAHLVEKKKFRNLAAVQLLAATGIRGGEFESITRDDLSISERWVRVDGKGGLTRTIPFDRETADILSRCYLADLTAMTKKSLQIMLGRASKSAGIPHTTPHQLRHYFATEAVSRGCSTPWLQLMLGHQLGSPATRVYVHQNLDLLRREYDRLF